MTTFIHIFMALPPKESPYLVNIMQSLNISARVPLVRPLAPGCSRSLPPTTQVFAVARHNSHRQPYKLHVNAEASAADGDIATQAGGTSELIEVVIKKPLGLVLAEGGSSGSRHVFVEEIVPGGNAEKNGMVRVGDVLAKTSAVMLKSGKDGSMSQGHGDRLYDNWETVEFDCSGQDFSTVMAAIGSNNERWGIKTVTLTLRRDAA